MGRTGIYGYINYIYNRDKYAVTDAPLCSLIARIGPNAVVFSLQLGPASCYGDNFGSITLTIRET